MGHLGLGSNGVEWERSEGGGGEVGSCLECYHRTASRTAVLNNSSTVEQVHLVAAALRAMTGTLDRPTRKKRLFFFV